MAHGLIFIAFVVAALLVGIAHRWKVGTWLLALLASIVPLCSVIFLIWADRTGRMGAASVARRRPRNQADRSRKRRDRLGGVTRPRPPVGPGPSIAGAVDLSGLEQRPAPAAEPGQGSAGASRGVELTEANFEAEVLPVQPGAGRRGAVVAAQRCERPVGQRAGNSGRRRRRQVVAGNRERRHDTRVAQIFGVQAVPTVVALAGGQPLSSFQGPQPPDQLRGWLDSLLNATAGKLDGGGEARRARAGRPRIGAGACPSGRR